jgi:cobalamin biosynthesis Mg chelatase CobN
MPDKPSSMPDPEDPPGLDRGQGVDPGDTPPASSQTSGVSAEQQSPTPSDRTWPLGWIIAIAVVVVLVGGMFIAMALSLAGSP